MKGVSGPPFLSLIAFASYTRGMSKDKKSLIDDLSGVHKVGRVQREGEGGSWRTGSNKAQKKKQKSLGKASIAHLSMIYLYNKL